MLPYIEDFKPDDSGVSPLARHEEWYRVAVPAVRRARRGARPTCRDTFLDSAWYFLRYPSVGSRRRAVRRGADEEVAAGDDATSAATSTPCCTCCTRASSRWCCTTRGIIDFEEPFTRFRAHGMIMREGAKMSKSRGNVVNPDQYIERVGRRRVPHVPDVPRPVRGGRRLPRPEHLGREALPRPALWRRCTTRDATARRDPAVHAQAAPDDQEGRRGHPASELQHGDRGDDGVHERAARAASARRTATRCEPLVQLVAPVRAAHRRGAVGAARRRRASVFDSGWPSFDAALAAEDSVDDRRAGERQDARDDQRRRRRRRRTKRWPRRWPSRRSRSS